MASSRGSFSSRIGFIAAAAGSAVGLGNIWRFPYETGENGGAAFLLVYLFCAFVICMPIMVAEIAMGRNTKLNPVGAFSKLGGKSWGIVGLFGVICGFMILSFYNVVAGWAFGYFLQISFGDLLANGNYSEFFGSYVSNISDNFSYSLVFMLITAIIVARGIKNGIELAAKVLMPVLIVIMVALIAYSLTLPNATEGLKYYLIPNFKLINISTIYAALGQAFFSLSLGMGALITFGSYVSKGDNIVSSALIVTMADTMIAFMAGLLIFPLVFSMGGTPSAGPGLVFVALPGIFESMGPVMGKVIGGGFFLLLCFAALTSTISLLEVPVAFVVDHFKLNRVLTVGLLSSGIFLAGIPSMLSQGASPFFTEFITYSGGPKDWLTFIDDAFSNAGLPLGGFLISVFVAYRWRMHKFANEIENGHPGFKGTLSEKFVTVMISYISPAVVGVIFVITVLSKFFGIDLL